MDDTLTTAITGSVESKPTITLKEIRETITVDFPNRPSISRKKGVSNILQGAFYSLKKLELVPIQWNCTEVKLERKQYMEWMVMLDPNFIWCT